jgi:phage/plasmid-like protein (TIGR03299 family)
MAHALAKIHHNGQYRMMYRKRTDADRPWHDAETKCPAWDVDPTIEEVIAGLEAYVDIINRPVYDCKGVLIPEIQETWRPICDENGSALLGADGNPLGDRLGIVGPKYTVVQDHEVIRFFEPWVDAEAVTIETGGAIFGGKRFWVLAKLNRASDSVVEGDEICHYILAINGHDGCLAFRAFPTSVRVVCNNTVQLALTSKLAKRFRKKHNANIHMKIEEVRQELEDLENVFAGNLQQFKFLAAADVKSEDDLKGYFQKVLQKKVDPTEEVKDDGKRPLPTLMRLFEEGTGLDMPGVKGTYWAAYNCVTEYVTHLRSRNSDARLDNMVNGIGAEMLGRALKVGMDFADGNVAQAA